MTAPHCVLDGIENHWFDVSVSASFMVMDCVFCRLIREDAAAWIAREPTACAFAPLDPIAPGHTLVVPTRHVADLFDAPTHVLTDTMLLVKRVAEAMRAALDADGVNLLHASGPGSEQSILHLHVHVIPRWRGDELSTWPLGRSRHQAAGAPASTLADFLTK
jgi:histidine triad (HIT) family protein